MLMLPGTRLTNEGERRHSVIKITSFITSEADATGPPSAVCGAGVSASRYRLA